MWDIFEKSMMDMVSWSRPMASCRTLPSSILLLTLLLLCGQFCRLDACEFGAPIQGSQECVSFTPEDAEDIKRTFYLAAEDSLPDTPIKLYYRYLWLYKNYLMVGAKNYLITLDKSNIQNKSSPYYHILLDEPRGERYRDSCRGWGVKVDPDCQNHIHYITRNTSYPDSDIVYVCGTGGYQPTGFLYNITSRDRVTSYVSTINNAKAMCPYDPFDNTTAIYTTRGNPENLPALYSAANADYTKSIPTIFRSRIIYPNGSLAYEYLTTAMKDPKWLNEPQFVGSFDMEEVVYFFFREEALEHSHSCGKKVYSRVARVCKNDKGGPNVVKYQWTSYQKARLNCSIPGKIQYYFDEIQDIRWDEASRTFYALFTTSSYGVTGSAICAYTQDDIEAAFSGPFQYPSNGTQVPTASEPTPRPGNCAGIPDSTRVTNDFVTFVKEKTLMYYAVQHKFGEPIFMKPNIMLQKLQTHFFPSYNVFFTGSNEGQVYQIYQPTSNLSETLISAVISPEKESGPVWSLQYDRDTMMLYVGYDKFVVQLELKKLCKKYSKADSCVFNPFCGWYNGQCFEHDHTSLAITYCKLAQMVKNNPTNHNLIVWETLLQIFVNGTTPATKNINQGGLVTMDIRMPLCTSGSVNWHFGEKCTDNMAKVPRNMHILGADNSLTIRNASLTDEGCYSAKDENGRDLAFYMLKVQRDEAEKEDLWTQKFYEWCDEFEDYKNRINHWKSSCSGDHSNTIPNVPGG